MPALQSALVRSSPNAFAKYYVLPTNHAVRCKENITFPLGRCLTFLNLLLLHNIDAHNLGDCISERETTASQVFISEITHGFQLNVVLD
jgi:hypothetical protein